MALDRRGQIEDLVWTEFSGSLRPLLDNRYVFKDFWSFVNGTMSDGCRLPGRLVPLLIELTMDHPETLWGDACYPVVQEA